MKQFFKFMFASMLGFIVAGVILIFIVAGIIAAAVSSISDKKQGEVSISENAVLYLNLNLPIQERSQDNPFVAWGMGANAHSLGLNDLLNNIHKAKRDPKIKGILLEADYIVSGYAALEELRNALNDFRTSGKFVYAYSEMYVESNYYLSSVADRIFMNPAGEVLFNGMSADVLFFKDALDKMGVEAQVIRHGKYKGAMEPFMFNKLSPENREQIAAYVNSIYNHYLESVSKSRKVSVDELRDIANTLKIQRPQDAVSYHLIDELAFRDQVDDAIRKKLNVGKDDKLNLVSVKKYQHADVPGDEKATLDRIAVIYAVGEIRGGEGDEENIGSETLVRNLIKARKDKNIKAVVLRINSPGGSALASDVIAREVELLRQVKPVIVSMGNVAASGGYFIAALADSIVAQPNTITGSIGVFGVIPNAQKLMNDKLGLHIDVVKTGEYADLGRIDRPLNEGERAFFQRSVDKIYDDFVKIVARGRNLSYAQVDSIAQGRVWTGIDAKSLGLVDVMGGLDKSIEIAAYRAGLKTYRVKNLPEQEDFFSKMIKTFGNDIPEEAIRKQLGASYDVYRKVQSAIHMQGVQARMPYDIQVQ